MVTLAPHLLLIAFLGGILPSLVWLFFWLLEDRCEPEPKKYLFITFAAGMAAVAVVIPLELKTQALGGIAMLAAWALIEEGGKLAAAWFALRSYAFNEPVDAVIYMVTAALGFAALENTLFLLAPLQEENAVRAFVMGDLRFMGATLLHVLASATIGLSIALGFSLSRTRRLMYLAAGVILAISLHTLFNFFILYMSGLMFGVFTGLWAAIVLALYIVEKIKVPSRDYC